MVAHTPNPPPDSLDSADAPPSSPSGRGAADLGGGEGSLSPPSPQPQLSPAIDSQLIAAFTDFAQDPFALTKTLGLSDLDLEAWYERPDIQHRLQLRRQMRLDRAHL